MRAGEKNSQHKLTLAQVEQLRSDYYKGNVKQVQLARRFGITKRQVRRIINKEQWQ